VTLAAVAPAAFKTSWRPSILDAYMVRKLAMPALAVLGVTLVAFLLEQTLRLINQLEADGAHIGYLFGLITNMVPYQLGLALPASFFAAMFIVIARLDEESEIDAILAGGIPFERIVAPLVFVGVVLGIVSLLLVAFFSHTAGSAIGRCSTPPLRRAGRRNSILRSSSMPDPTSRSAPTRWTPPGVY
jgi:hypothetical protein